MRTLWVAVVLCFVQVCQPVPLTCDKLAKHVENVPELSGRWYYIAISTEVCLPTSLINSIFWPSVAVDITSKDTPNLYATNIMLKMYGFCMNETEDFFLKNSNIFEVNSENAPVGDPDILLQTSCSDCIVIKTNDTINILSLLSRRKTINEDELREFETQAKCVGFSKPQVLNTDKDFDNCLDIDNISEDQSEALLIKVYERVKSTSDSIFKCIVDMFLSYLPVTIS